jgi:hypothetical protein
VCGDENQNFFRIFFVGIGLFDESFHVVI